MSTLPLLKVVIDTNILLEGLTKQGSAAGLAIDVWLQGRVSVYISDALAYEYQDVLSRKLSPVRWAELKPVLGTLISRSTFTPIYYSWRPTSPDPGDDLVIDCAMNASAIVVTSNLRDFKTAKQQLGLQLMTALELLKELMKRGY